jgi:hypothetical protein
MLELKTTGITLNEKTKENSGIELNENPRLSFNLSNQINKEENEEINLGDSGEEDEEEKEENDEETDKILKL